MSIIGAGGAGIMYMLIILYGGLHYNGNSRWTVSIKKNFQSSYILAVILVENACMYIMILLEMLSLCRSTSHTSASIPCCECHSHCKGGEQVAKVGGAQIFDCVL